ncbi:MAG: outer membrane protein [Desulfovibrionaceae bacterium]
MKRIIMCLALCLCFALPAQAEVNGMYVGLKFIDAIQNTGTVSKDNIPGGSGIGQYGQNSIGGGIAIGYDFYPKMQLPIRAEVEYARRGNMQTTWDSQHLPLGGGITAHLETEAQWDAQTLFANFYYDFHNSTAFTPYVGAGLGVAFMNTTYTVNGVASVAGVSPKIELLSKSKMSTNFAWNVGLGCSYAVNENFSVDLAYRFVKLGQTEVEKNDMSLKTNPYSNEFSLGLRMTF